MPRPAGALPAEFAEIGPDSWTEPFWLAAREHRLTIPKCVNCGAFRFPPGPFCPECLHQQVEQVQVSGAGTIYTFTVARQGVVPVLADYVPYVVAVVELDGAPAIRVIGNIVASDPDAVEIGSRVEVAWDDVTDEVTIPRFRLAGEE